MSLKIDPAPSPNLYPDPERLLPDPGKNGLDPTSQQFPDPTGSGSGKIISRTLRKWIDQSTISGSNWIRIWKDYFPDPEKMDLTSQQFPVQPDPNPTELLKLTIVFLFRVKLLLPKKMRNTLVFSPYWRRRRKREEGSASQMRDPTRLNQISLSTWRLPRPPIHPRLVLSPGTPVFNPLKIGGVVYRRLTLAAVAVLLGGAVCLL
jgi:hypothetical protein